MCLAIIVKATGRLLAVLPEPLLRGLCALLGDALYFGVPWRVRVIHSNLHHAFPERSTKWRRRMARCNCRRFVEFGMIGLASPFFSEKRAARSLTLAEDTPALLDQARADRKGVILLIPHFTLAELTTIAPLHYPVARGCQVLYRPLKQPAVDRWVKGTRERFGCQLISRVDDLNSLRHHLNAQGMLAMLFDQAAGRAGVLFPFFGRIVSGTYLPSILARRSQTVIFMAIPTRVRFWKTRLQLHHLPESTRPDQIPFAAHDFLEELLSTSDDDCADWLWIHDRWKHRLAKPNRRLQFRDRKLRLNDYLHHRGEQYAFPNRARYWFRLPESDGEIEAVRPFLETFSINRIDTEITLLGAPKQLKATTPWTFVHRRRELPWKPTRAERHDTFPDVFICLARTPQAARECLKVQIPQRLGWESSKPYITHTVANDASWNDFFTAFGWEKRSD